MTEASQFEALSAALRQAATPTLTLEDFSRAMKAAYEQMPRLTGRITLGPGPFRCRRCLDLGWVSDWANWPVGWAWQRVEPVPRIPCPTCRIPR